MLMLEYCLLSLQALTSTVSPSPPVNASYVIIILLVLVNTLTANTAAFVPPNTKSLYAIIPTLNVPPVNATATALFDDVDVHVSDVMSAIVAALSLLLLLALQSLLTKLLVLVLLCNFLYLSQHYLLL